MLTRQEIEKRLDEGQETLKLLIVERPFISVAAVLVVGALLGKFLVLILVVAIVFLTIIWLLAENQPVEEKPSKKKMKSSPRKNGRADSDTVTHAPLE